MDTSKLKLIATDDFDAYADGDEEIIISEYNEAAECNDWPEAKSIEDERLRDYFNDQMVNDYDYFIDEYGKNDVMVIADLGLWNRHVEGSKRGKLRELIASMIQDYNYLYYNPEDGTFVLKAIHHDGTNYFTIYCLTEKGVEYANEHYYTMDHEDNLKLVETEGMTARFELE